MDWHLRKHSEGIQAVLSAFGDGERLTLSEIHARLLKQGVFSGSKQKLLGFLRLHMEFR